MTDQVVIEAALGEADPLAASARFHAEFLPQIEAALSGGAAVIAVVFDHGEDKAHAWRRTAIAALARKYAPARVNGLAPAGPDADLQGRSATLSFLAGNAGVTGQLLLLG